MTEVKEPRCARCGSTAVLADGYCDFGLCRKVAEEKANEAKDILLGHLLAEQTRKVAQIYRLTEELAEKEEENRQLRLIAYHLTSFDLAESEEMKSFFSRLLESALANYTSWKSTFQRSTATPDRPTLGHVHGDAPIKDAPIPVGTTPASAGQDAGTIESVSERRGQEPASVDREKA